MNNYATNLLSDLVYHTLIIELNGLHVDVSRFVELETKLEDRLLELENQIKQYSNQPDFNVNSNMQVAELLQDLGVSLIDETSTGKKKVSKGILKEKKHPITDLILEYRELLKQRGYFKSYQETIAPQNTYVGEMLKLSNDIEELQSIVEKYPNMSERWQKKHQKQYEQAQYHIENLRRAWILNAGHAKGSAFLYPEFRLNGTKTGRLSSKNPNAQNIPNTLGFKSIFTSRFDNGYIGSCDLSQAELRVAAYISEDDMFAKALAGGDAHSNVAQLVFGHEIDRSNPEHEKKRDLSKMIAFGLLYGGSAYGLAMRAQAQGMDVSIEDVENAYNKFFATFAKLGTWLEATKKKVVTQGYDISPLGRYYDYVPMVKNGKTKSAQRLATNAPIQGTSADILGTILCAVQDKMLEWNLKSVICNTVHDDILADIHPDEVEQVVAAFRYGYKQVAEIEWIKTNPVFEYLPFTGDLVLGRDWLEAKKESDNTLKYEMESHNV